MADRRALILGSWLAKGREKPTPQKVIALTSGLMTALQSEKLSYKSLLGADNPPDVLLNPMLGEIVHIFDNASDITGDTELLLYFIGHSTAHGENDINLIIGMNDQQDDRECSLEWLLNTIKQYTQIRKLVLMLDTCHAGRIQDMIRITGLDYYAMLATGSAYAYNSWFSEGLMRAIELPLRRKDQRIDRTQGGVTYQRIFEYARNYVIKKTENFGNDQAPRSCGIYSGEILLEAPVVIPDEYNEYISDRTVYGRLYRLLEIIQEEENVTLEGLHSRIQQDDRYLVKRNIDGSGNPLYISKSRLADYLEFLCATEWVIRDRIIFKITTEGLEAMEKAFWNRNLIDAIERSVLPEQMTMGYLEDIVSELLLDMLPATPIKLKERAGMKGIPFHLSPATRVALQVLPSTGRFMKGSADAIFPSERGGEVLL